MNMYEGFAPTADEYLAGLNDFILESTILSIEQVKYARVIGSLASNEKALEVWNDTLAEFETNKELVASSLTFFKNMYRRSVHIDMPDALTPNRVSGIKIDTATGLYLAELRTPQSVVSFEPITPTTPLAHS